MLIPGIGFSTRLAVRGLLPVPLTSGVSSQSPKIVKRSIGAGTSAKHQEHLSLLRRLPDAAGVVDSGHWLDTLALHFLPLERNLVHVQHPHIVEGFLPGVSPEDDDVGLEVGHAMAVADSRAGTLHRHLHPRASMFIFDTLQKEKVVLSQYAVAYGPAVDDELHLLHGSGRVRGTRTGLFLILGDRVEFLPALSITVEEISITGDPEVCL